LRQLLRAIFSGFGSTDCLRVGWSESFGTTDKGGWDRIHILGNLRYFIHDGATRVSLRNGKLRSKWIPPGQMFWAIATTIGFALGSIALLSRRSALLASRLLTAMLIGFQLLVWLPAPFVDPHKMINWAGNAQNLAITGAAWIIADFLNHKAFHFNNRRSKT